MSPWLLMDGTVRKVYTKVLEKGMQSVKGEGSKEASQLLSADDVALMADSRNCRCWYLSLGESVKEGSQE